MRDQVKKPHDLGVSAVSLLSGIESDEEVKALEEGNYSVLYGTAESLLKTERWLRRMLDNKVHSNWFVLCLLWLLMHEAYIKWYML
jgi:superfamily II DNA helicase RecQ